MIVSGMRLNLKVVNDELARLGHKTELARGSGYFFFRGSEADDWIDRMVAVGTINSLTLKQWIEEYHRLQALNERIMKTVKAGDATGGNEQAETLLTCVPVGRKLAEEQADTGVVRDSDGRSSFQRGCTGGLYLR
jgi:hypothetical protein